MCCVLCSHVSPAVVGQSSHGKWDGLCAEQMGYLYSVRFGVPNIFVHQSLNPVSGKRE